MYKQTITSKKTITVKVVNYTDVPKSCYCKFDDSGIAALNLYTASRDGQYMIAEGRSDHTVFMLLKLLSYEGEGYTAEFVECCTNPIPSVSTFLSTVEWYDEYGFCKLHFFDVEQIPQGNPCRRLYFDRDLYQKMRLALQGQQFPSDDNVDV